MGKCNRSKGKLDYKEEVKKCEEIVEEIAEDGQKRDERHGREEDFCCSIIVHRSREQLT